VPSTYSPNLRIELIASGEQANTWGYSTDNNLGTLIEQAISGEAAITMADADVTLSSLNGVTDQARQMIIRLTGTNTAVRNVIAPAVNKIYVVSNGTTGGYSINIKTSASGSAGVLVPNGTSMIVWSDGTNFYSANTAMTAAIVEGNLTVAGTLAAFPASATPTTGVGSFGVLSDGTYGGGLGLFDSANSVSWGLYDASGVLNIGTGSGLSGALTPNLTLNQSGNLTATGSVSGSAGSFSGSMTAASLAGGAATGTGASGTWGINISGNAATASTLTGNWTSMPAGTVVVFYQAAAPTGWTQVTSQNDAALRVVSGTGGTAGGTVGFTTAFASQAVSGSVSIATATGTVGGTALSTAQLPAHSHGVTDPTHAHSISDPGHAHALPGNLVSGVGAPGTGSVGQIGPTSGPTYGAVTGISINAAATGISIQNTGSGATHTHSLTMNAQTGTFTGNSINLAVAYINTIICSKN